MRLAFAAFVPTVFLFGAACAFSAEAGCEKEEAIKGLHEEIFLLNLVNALNLTKDQFESLARLAAEYGRARTEYEKKAMASADENEAILKRLKEFLEANPSADLPKALTGKYHAVDGNLKRLDLEFNEIRSALDKKLNAVFSDGQKDMIATYKPCIIPTKSLSDPTRVGQAAEGDRGQEMMKRARKMPDAEFRTFRDRILEGKMEPFEIHMMHKMKDSERPAFRSKLVETLEEARRMSDQDFEMNKADLAAKADPEARIKKLQETMAELGGPKFSKAGRFFFSPGAAKILEKRARGTKPNGLADRARE